ncbi:MAG: peptidoglycan-binding protein [Candidatus Nanopelagicales bacterium]
MAAHRGLLRTAVTGLLVTLTSGALVLTSVPAAQAAPVASGASPSAAVRAASPPVLVYGSRDAWVENLQWKLQVRPISGWFGPRTKKAVIALQKRHGLKATGKVNAATWRWVNAEHYARVEASRDEDRPAPPPQVQNVDPTMTDKARTSEAHRKTIPFEVWQQSPHGKAIVKRESGGVCSITSPGGTYRGKWQMSAAFWSAYGGKEFASTADRATCEEQDLVAYRGWIDSWWLPWGG